MKLKIKESSWSGWKNDYIPDEIEKEYEIEKNKKYIIRTREVSHLKEGKMIEETSEIFSFDIIEINENNILIRTYQDFSDNDDASINLNSEKRDFIISVGKETKLVTPTMDCGDIFYISLIK